MSTDELESKLNHTFRDRNLLQRALTHKSRAFEDSTRGGEPSRNNEQLEFLGDAVLGFLVSEVLVELFPDRTEGWLSKAKARLVSADHLYKVARELDLGRFLRLGRGEEMSGGRAKRALLADSTEALIAAIYLDGGYGPARRFVSGRIVDDLDPDEVGEEVISDFKGALQEFVQARKLPAPRYHIVGTDGPEHSKTFRVEVQVAEGWSATADGASKKSAGQEAASILLRRMTQELGDQ